MWPGHSKPLTFVVVLLVLSTAGAATVGTVSTAATVYEGTPPQSATDRGPIQTTQSDGVSPPRLFVQ